MAARKLRMALPVAATPAAGGWWRRTCRGSRP